MRDFLRQRGIKSEADQTQFLAASLQSMRHPFVLRGMETAAERLVQAYRSQEHVLIYGDYDLDGTSATALLSTGLKQLGFKNIHTFQPHRFNDGYGVHQRWLEHYKQLGIQLVVTVDLGITNVEEVEWANQNQLDVIITDHHQPREIVPPAVSVINPNQNECTSQMGFLCGTGVAFYLVLATKIKMAEAGFSTSALDTKALLDFFAMGTIADMVPLTHENRALVKHGLKVLSSTPRAGIKELMVELGVYGSALKANDVAMRVAPKLNALSRMASELSILELYLETEKQKAFEKVQTALSTNKLRQALQNSAVTEALAQAEQFAQDSFVYVYHKDFHPGIVGLIATQLTQTLNKVAFVSGHNQGSFIGSARLPSGLDFDVVTALRAAESHLEKFGGHKAAAGFEVEEENHVKVIDALKEFFKTVVLTPQQKALEFDLKLSLSEMNYETMDWLDQLEPFGMGFDAPKMLLENLEVMSVQILKDKFLKLVLREGDYKIEGMWFSVPGDYLKERLPRVGQSVNIVGLPQRSTFRGNTKLQFLIEQLSFETIQ